MSTKDYLVIPESFEGFKKEAFDLLQSYKDNPDSEYNKDIFNKYVRNPFKEIQEGLFSCIQEGLSEYNLTDKSARSSHANRANKPNHHFWAAIYREKRNNKSNDLQHFWYICENMFKFGLYTGDKADKLSRKIVQHILSDENKLEALTKLAVNGHSLKIVIDDTNGFPIKYLEVSELKHNDELLLNQGVNFCFEYSKEEIIDLKSNFYIDMVEGFKLLKPLYKFLLECDHKTVIKKTIDEQISASEEESQKIEHEMFVVNNFISNLENCNLQFRDRMIKRFVASLLSKPFVILTGLSGSGKTKLAQAFVTWICNPELSKYLTAIDTTVKYSEKSVENSFGWTLKKEVVEQLIGEEDKYVKSNIAGIDLEKCKLEYKNIFYYKSDEQKENLSKKIKEEYSIGDEIPVTIFIDKESNPNESEQYKLIPVGADWTNREPLLGYPNALETGKYVKPENGVLDLVLNAIENPAKPFFLILDEMNLSHVERYFADFLSAMESEEDIPLHPDSNEWKDENGDWNDGIPASIKLPNNLFIIGTVNIDETTYMFSPKVLDRANVIEFRVTDKELNEFLKNPARPDLDFIKGKGEAMAADFVKLAKAKAQNSDDSDKVKETLLEFFRYLKIAGAEFGYRTAFEISKFCAKLSLITQDNMWEIDEKLDAAIMQKLLPKLHGSRKKLEPVLNSLAILCLVDNEKQRLLTAKKDKNQNIGNLVDEAVEIEENIRFKLSMEKIIRMKKRVIQDGFTSFAEA